MPVALPIDPHIAEIVSSVRDRRALVLIAAPGAGKTTRVPPALSDAGRVLVLQPRRIAARSVARRIAEEQGWEVGREVGWHVRFERQFERHTRVLIATEGILTSRLHADPLLSDLQTVVLDEFHERSVHADLGIAMVREAWRARGDLRLVIMSATIDPVPVARFLGNCPVLEVPGSLHPMEVRYRPSSALGDAVSLALSASRGQILCFLPGAPEIRRAHADLAPRLAASGVEIVSLHGSQDAKEQDIAVAPANHRRVILATNIAETSLTVPGVGVVIDTGFHKVLRYDPGRGIDRLETERISQDAADQRAGRAARVGPGVVYRLWSEADRLRPHRESDVSRIDMSGPILDVLAWGGDPETFDWFEAPPDDVLRAGCELLERLGAAKAMRLTELGRRMCRLPLSARLSRILLEGGGAPEAAVACALLSERQLQQRSAGERPTTSNDLWSAFEASPALPQVLRVAAVLQAAVPAHERRARLDDEELRYALFCGYPDRVGKRRAPGSPRVLLASGHGAVIGSESGVRAGEFVVALDVSGRRGETAEALIRIASVVERDWLRPTRSDVQHGLNEETGVVRAVARDYYGAIVLSERPAPADAERVAALVTEAYLAHGLSPTDTQLVRRLQFAGVAFDLHDLAARAAVGCDSLSDVSLAKALGGDERRMLERQAPASMDLPSGRRVQLEYEDDGTVRAGVKLQELFGLADTPRLGPRRQPVLIALLAPNGRPVQLTTDLRSFWDRTYPEVRKELRGRYPKHPWPEDPWTAVPTARTKRRS